MKITKLLSYLVNRKLIVSTLFWRTSHLMLFYNQWFDDQFLSLECKSSLLTCQSLIVFDFHSPGIVTVTWSVFNKYLMNEND